MEREKGLGCISKMNTYHSSQKNELTLYSLDDLWNNLQLNEQEISSSYKDTTLILHGFFTSFSPHVKIVFLLRQWMEIE